MFSKRPDPMYTYPTAAAWRADVVVHAIGMVLALVGGAVIFSLALALGAAHATAIGIYAAGFVLMLAFSAAYNFSRGKLRPIYRRLDHSGIFLMIAGSYTPFTTLALKGGWAWGMTTAVWTIAGLGILGKIFVPHLREGIWIALYLSLGWIVVLAAGPVIEALSTPAIVLLVLGGLVYSAGVIWHVRENLQYSRSIWHGHVVAGAGVHWAAILVGTILPALAR